ncbi:MAG: DMT family transporter [Verrucomicrobiota bacterium]
MTFAILTAFLFALSAVSGRKLGDALGSLRANYIRLALAFLVLAALTAAFDPGSLHPTTFAWLFLSGLVGFGIGDVALYLALTRIGARLTILVNFSLATILGAMGDWLWLGDIIAPGKWLPITTILAGLTLALLAARTSGMARIGSYGIGLFAAVVAGMGQGFGSSISRIAHDAAETLQHEMTGISEACQRVFAGLLFALIASRLAGRRNSMTSNAPAPGWRRYLLGAALFGPVIGVSCFQQALQLQPSAVVLAIVATSPILLIPISAILEGDRPTRLSILGSVVAVGGVIWLTLFEFP